MFILFFVIRMQTMIRVGKYNMGLKDQKFIRFHTSSHRDYSKKGSLLNLLYIFWIFPPRSKWNSCTPATTVLKNAVGQKMCVCYIWMTILACASSVHMTQHHNSPSSHLLTLKGIYLSKTWSVVNLCLLRAYHSKLKYNNGLCSEKLSQPNA